MGENHSLFSRCIKGFISRTEAFATDLCCDDHFLSRGFDKSGTKQKVASALQARFQLLSKNKIIQTENGCHLCLRCWWVSGGRKVCGGHIEPRCGVNVLPPVLDQWNWLPRTHITNRSPNSFPREKNFDQIWIVNGRVENSERFTHVRLQLIWQFLHRACGELCQSLQKSAILVYERTNNFSHDTSKCWNEALRGMQKTSLCCHWAWCRFWQRVTLMWLWCRIQPRFSRWRIWCVKQKLDTDVWPVR